MIELTQALDLGADRTRMKNAHDVERQNETARSLLRRLYGGGADQVELQLLADEVGMGKTFVALAVAYSVLEAQKGEPELAGCYQKVLVLVPQNDELKNKWHREVGEIVKRCAKPEYQKAAQALFKAKTVEKPDDLVAALRKGTERVVVAKTSSLGARIKDEDVKARLTLATLFRHFGRALPLETREVLLKGAPGWPTDPTALRDKDEEEKCLPLPGDVIEAAIRNAAERELQDEAGAILALCKEWGTPNVRRRDEGFAAIRRKLIQFYKHACWSLLGSDLPLVIVDEAHQWKNKRHDFPAFSQFIAPRARRALLLTATPFQLHPSEILSLLEVSDFLGIPETRRAALTEARVHVVKPALERAQTESLAFARKWASLGGQLDPVPLRDTWDAPAASEARAALAGLANEFGALSEAAVAAVVQKARHHLAPELRDFVCQALRLYAFNRDLGDELGRFVVRHRRSTQHRIVRAGHEIDHDAELLKQRPDAHVLHAAPGLDVHGDDELPLYLLMRATAELEGGKRTADLGSSLTGCYSTFFMSAASASFANAADAGNAATYVQLLNDLVGDPSADATHPKMRRVVQEAVERWERGEKTLIFTFRVNTAERLYDLIDEQIRQRLSVRRDEALGGAEGLKRLQQRLSSKAESLYQPMLDRVLWSMLWAPPDEGSPPISSTSLRPTLDDYREVARLALTYGEDILGKTPDRVFLHRAAESSVARRIRDEVPKRSRFRQVLDRMAKDDWVERPYGLDKADEEGSADELADERGVQAVYGRKRKPHPAEVEELAQQLLERDKRLHQTGQVGVVRQAFVGPSFWLGHDPEDELLAREHHPADVEVDRSDQRFLHVHLRALTWDRESGELDFRTRALALKAMRRALLRESILVRLLPKYEEREEESWAHLLVRRFTEPVEGRRESMLRLVGVFVEDLAACSGGISDKASARGSLYDATMHGKSRTVELVKGDTDKSTRSRRFQGFNTPLLPEILICGKVAQEGIDLHRHCGHVVHYDLAWNPATLEQRTGRIDRIGSRTQRLRQLGTGATSDLRLEVSAPYLAGTYDERMFEELRLRAQTFEVLLGGDLSGSRPDAPTATAASDDASDEPPEDEGDERASGLVALPEHMADTLRVDLAVWKPSMPPTNRSETLRDP